MYKKGTIITVTDEKLQMHNIKGAIVSYTDDTISFRLIANNYVGANIYTTNINNCVISNRLYDGEYKFN